MWSAETGLLSAGWLCWVLLSAVNAQSGIELTRKLGDDVVLDPGVTGPITSIIWKDGGNIAMEWDGTGEVDSYRHLKERGSLNLTNGAMTIMGVTMEDSGTYTSEINNNNMLKTFILTVLSAVPKPSVSESCNDEKTSCTLTCDGNTTHAGAVTYTWRSGDMVLGSTKEQHITKNGSSSMSEFVCELQNPVSRESSTAHQNPLHTAEKAGKLNISTGVTVFIALLLAVLLLAAIHRCKAGMWFYQKTSGPWESDFWKNEMPQRNAVETNGAAAQEKSPSEETSLNP